jgi:transglutaminase-like putative cysteine protease
MSIKKTLLKLTSLLVLVLVLFFAYPIKPASADVSNFTTDYHVSYNVQPNGITHASIDISLTNNSSQYYASSYKVQLGFDNITNISATDPDGSINPVLNKTDDGYIIGLTFNKKAVGLNAKLNFNLSFDTPNVAQNFGKIWEINIPGIANPSDFQTFTVEVNVPSSFGKPVYIKPAQNSNNLIFTKDQLGKSGISLAFGDKQIYVFHLIYHLKNDNVVPVKTEVALPPSTNYQDVFIQDIEPRPDNVTVDKDGNWLAQFKLLPAQKLDVTVDGKAQMQLTPKPQDISQKDIAIYTQDKPYWQAQNDKIREVADTLKTPEAIYQYVVKTLKYDFSRVTENKPRLGALAALQNPNSAVCLEFTDLFIALARAEGIPAREVDGFAYTENPKQRPVSLVKDILHAWPEYYDTTKKTWVMVDPTWGSTTGGVDYFSTMDFDHFAFVVKGIDSSYPIPAGGYKLLTDKNAKDVNVDFGDTITNQQPSFDITSNIPQYAMSGLPISGSMTVTNTGQSLIPAQLMYVQAANLSPNTQSLDVGPIPPFGSASVPVDFNAVPFLTNGKQQFTIQIADRTSTQVINFSPLLIQKWGIIEIGGIILGILAIIILIITRKSRRL